MTRQELIALRDETFVDLTDSLHDIRTQIDVPPETYVYLHAMSIAHQSICLQLQQPQQSSRVAELETTMRTCVDLLKRTNKPGYGYSAAIIDVERILTSMVEKGGAS